MESIPESDQSKKPRMDVPSVNDLGAEALKFLGSSRDPSSHILPLPAADERSLEQVLKEYVEADEAAKNEGQSGISA